VLRRSEGATSSEGVASDGVVHAGQDGGQRRLTARDDPQPTCGSGLAERAGPPEAAALIGLNAPPAQLANLHGMGWRAADDIGDAPRLSEALDRWANANPEPGPWPHWLGAQLR